MVVTGLVVSLFKVLLFSFEVTLTARYEAVGVPGPISESLLMIVFSMLN